MSIQWITFFKLNQTVAHFDSSAAAIFVNTKWQVMSNCWLTLVQIPAPILELPVGSGWWLTWLMVGFPVFLSGFSWWWHKQLIKNMRDDNWPSTLFMVVPFLFLISAAHFKHVLYLSCSAGGGSFFFLISAAFMVWRSISPVLGAVNKSRVQIYTFTKTKPMWLLNVKNLTLSIPILCRISHPSVYHFQKKTTQFWPNWILFTIICPKYTQFM